MIWRVLCASRWMQLWQLDRYDDMILELFSPLLLSMSCHITKCCILPMNLFLPSRWQLSHSMKSHVLSSQIVAHNYIRLSSRKLPSHIPSNKGLVSPSSCLSSSPSPSLKLELDSRPRSSPRPTTAPIKEANNPTSRNPHLDDCG